MVKLKALALEVDTILQTLPSSAKIEWERDVRIALKGIVEERKLPAKQPKPALNTTDLDDPAEY